MLAAAFLAHNFAGVVQRIADEFIGVAVVTGILGADSFQSFFKADSRLVAKSLARGADIGK